jgi:hypothetical protein
MSAKDHLDKYAEGWTKGDPDKILGAVADDYSLDDQDAGQITKHDFPNHMNQLKVAVSSLRNAEPEAQFMELSEVVAQQEGEDLTVWCWWAIPGTEIEGSGLIKVTAAGVLPNASPITRNEATENSQ